MLRPPSRPRRPRITKHRKAPARHKARRLTSSPRTGPPYSLEFIGDTAYVTTLTGKVIKIRNAGNSRLEAPALAARAPL